MQKITVSILNKRNSIYEISEKNISEKIVCEKKGISEIEFSSSDAPFLQLKVAEILTEYVIDFEEEKLLKNILFTDYPTLNLSEKNQVLYSAIQIINENESDFLRMLILLKRRFLIKQNILEYLNSQNFINMDGFVSFRLNSYKKMLSELIQKVIDDYNLQKEYKEFIEMLRFFVETQKDRCSKLHIVFEANGEYSILNENNSDITQECFSEFLETKEKNNLNNEDVLISSLITLAPKKVFLHFEDEHYNKKIVKTIEQIFENKVFISSEPLLELVQ